MSDLFPRTVVGGVSMPRMLIGTNWLFGWSHTGPAADAGIREKYQTPEDFFPVLKAYMERGVDAIDVFCEDQPDQTYRYDPNGNIVESGDVVLVPMREENDDNEIVREAEVSRGNYKVDPETLDRPLKKIIGVVKRKAEQIFTAMITPMEENEDQE